MCKFALEIIHQISVQNLHTFYKPKAKTFKIMASKKFAQMSNKKLNALLETASEEDAVAIKAVLEAREAAKNEEAAPAAASTELTPEEQAAIDAAEAGDEAPTEKPKKNSKNAGRKAAEKMTAEELDVKTEECKENVNHRCSLLLNGTAIRVNGTITGVLKDKRAMQVYYAVQTDESEVTESKRMYKKWNAEDLEILDEVVEVVKAKKQGSTSRVRKEKMTEEEWEATRDSIIAAASTNVGKVVALGDDVEGRVVSILVDKRSCGLYYRIEFENELGVKKYCHKVIATVNDEETGALTLVPIQGMAAELDEEGLKLNTAYQERKAREPRKVLTPEERVLKAEEDVKKAEATLAKAQETLTMRQNILATAKAELAAKHDAQEANVTGQGVAQATTEEPADEEEDLG